VKTLDICQDFFRPIAFALQKLVGERVIEVLPVLQTLCFKGLPAWKPVDPLSWKRVQKAFARFISARQLARHPIAAVHWKS
jgi:hypothetical protein